PPLDGGGPTGVPWVKLKTYPARQSGQPLRGTRFNRTTNKWVSFVSYRGREVEIASYDREDDAALAHDTKMVDLYGASATVNYPCSVLVDPITKRVRRLRSETGREFPFPEGVGGHVTATANVAGQQEIHGRSTAPKISSSEAISSGGVLGVNRYARGADTAKQPPLPKRVPRAPTGVEGAPQPQEDWVPLPERAYTGADLASVTNAREHKAGLVYEIVFPRPGALGLNLRSYLVEPTAGARPGLSPYGCLEVLEAQGTVVEPGDLLISINGQKLSGRNFAFESAIAKCSKAPMPRVLRFARMRRASAAEIECALAVEACAVFDADGHPKRLVTAQLHPSAPPYFHLNPPTRQSRTNLRGSASSSADKSSGATAALAAGAVGALDPSASVA
ncbi:unnamed protein product, partial [Ascophyllum nodosum]